MTEETEAASVDMNKFKSQGAFILGASGEIGKELVKYLVKSKIFNRLVLIGRRELDYSDKGDEYKSLIQRVVNFDKLEEHKDAFEGCEIGFCCLGTTRGKSGADGFYKVDHDYILNSAKIAKEKGCVHFNLVSSAGANANSYLLYPKTKGEVENECKDLGFERLTVLRPSMLLCDRQERRIGEKIILGLMKPIAYACPTWITIPTPTVAKGMILNTFLTPASPAETLDNARIHALGKEFDAKFQIDQN